MASPRSFFFPVTLLCRFLRRPPPMCHTHFGWAGLEDITDIPRHLHMQSVRRDGRHWRRRGGAIPITVREASLVAWGSKETSVSLPLTPLPFPPFSSFLPFLSVPCTESPFPPPPPLVIPFRRMPQQRPEGDLKNSVGLNEEEEEEGVATLKTVGWRGAGASCVCCQDRLLFIGEAFWSRAEFAWRAK